MADRLLFDADGDRQVDLLRTTDSTLLRWAYVSDVPLPQGAEWISFTQPYSDMTQSAEAFGELVLWLDVPGLGDVLTMPQESWLNVPPHLISSVESNQASVVDPNYPATFDLYYSDAGLLEQIVARSQTAGAEPPGTGQPRAETRRFGIEPPTSVGAEQEFINASDAPAFPFVSRSLELSEACEAYPDQYRADCVLALADGRTLAQWSDVVSFRTPGLDQCLQV